MTVTHFRDLVDQMGQTHLILDVNCLFVAATLREELWLYCRREDADLLGHICRQAEAFGIRKVNPDRELSTYSGGEQAILACLTLLALIAGQHQSQAIDLLLCGVMESISIANRARLEREFVSAAQAGGARIFQKRGDRIQCLDGVPCES